ncbi:DUF2063 domain-containing protein [Pseudorhodobacter sp. W20_MBD10_FR17]|uniref:HvfC/BufC N-terminal domain-containing protein n=1 Tax=Pseudorhodobacter sp. W20_MBD10_FR17 TaxID=3240266 RepID=UPI003F9D1654
MNETAFTQALLNPDLAIPAELVDARGRPAGRRFSVYRNNVAGSLTEALAQGFPVLRKLLGEAYFKALAGVFLRQFPPASRLIMLYGQEMPDFLAHFPPLANLPYLPYLPDVARLEIALREAYHAADAPAVAPETLATLPSERFLAARLHLAPAVRMVTSDYPVWSIWQANTNGGAPPTMRPEAALVLRPEYDAAPHLLPPNGALFMAALQAEKSVEHALELAGEGFDISTMLGLLINGGAITGICEEP